MASGGGIGRKTFYISDYQKAKQQREWQRRDTGDDMTSSVLSQ